MKRSLYFLKMPGLPKKKGLIKREPENRKKQESGRVSVSLLF